MIAKWKHLFPSRTQKLSTSAPMIVRHLPCKSRSLPPLLSINFDRLLIFDFLYAIILFERRISSAGRASALQAGGRRFEPVILHHAGLAQLVEQLTCNQ